MHKNRYYDSLGLYITATQLRFYLNDPSGFQSFRHYDEDFKHYFNECRTYNLISDLSIKDPNCAKFFWDESLEDIVIEFPSNGRVVKILNYLHADEEVL